MASRVLIDGIDVSKKLINESFSITRTEMGVTRASASLYEQMYNMNDELMIYDGEKLVFQGLIDKEYVEPGMFIAYASNYLIQLSDEVCSADDHYEYAEEEYADIVKDLLSYYFTGVFDVTNVDDTGLTCGHIDLKDKTVAEAMSILAQRSGFVFWLEPPNYIYFKERDSVSTGHSAVYGVNIGRLALTRDNFVKTKVVVRFPLGGAICNVEVGSGTRTAIVSDDTISTEEEAIDVGNSVLDQMQDIQIRGEISLTEPRHDLIPGKTIVLHAPRFGFSNETIRLKQVTTTAHDTQIVVGKMTAMHEDRLISFEDRLRQIENRGLRWATSCLTRTQTAPGCTGGCEIDCQVSCEALALCNATCQVGVCQTSCQLTQQITCATAAQVCGTEGTCQAACEAGHNCESTCESQCQMPCQTQCQVICQEACQGACETTCQTACELAAQSGCGITTCETGCETSCQSTCQLACQTYCETTCQTGCEISCQVGCEKTCEIQCQVETLCCGTVGPD